MLALTLHFKQQGVSRVLFQRILLKLQNIWPFIRGRFIIFSAIIHLKLSVIIR
ncbi:hypothetical protein P606_26455 [Comamonas thiooxydans]|nr:hypothetical protein P606_26455 [Comamonas thiooxydans]